MRREGWESAADSVGVAMSSSSAGKAPVRLARMLSSCCAGMAATTTSRLTLGGAETGVGSEIWFVVAIVFRGVGPGATLDGANRHWGSV